MQSSKQNFVEEIKSKGHERLYNKKKKIQDYTLKIRVSFLLIISTVFWFVKSFISTHLNNLVIFNFLSQFLLLLH